MSTPVTSDPAARRGYHHGNLREALLEAARRLAAERGPDGFTLADAARLAGVTPSAPYRHFKDREALMAELARRGAAQFGARLAAALEGGATPGEGFGAMGRAYLAFAREEPGYYAAIFAYRRPAGTDAAEEERAPGAPDGFATLLQALARVMPEGAAAGERGRLLALQIWALSHGLAGLERAGLPPPGSGAPPMDEVLKDGVERLIRGG